MAFCIKKFSSWFCFEYSSGESSFELDSNSPSQLSIDTERFGKIINKLYDMYRDELMPVIDKILNIEEFDCEFCMRNIISKCVKLSNPSNHLHFMLVCTFIHGILKRFRIKKDCFTFVKIVSQCLIAVYDRCYTNLFNNEANSETLQSYCIRLNTILSRRMTAKGCKKLAPFNKPKLIELMTNLKYRESKDFRLTNSELEMLNEILSKLPEEDATMNVDKSTVVSESDLTYSKETSSNEAESDESFSTDEIMSNKSNSGETFSKEEITSNEAESDETSSNEETTSNDAESDETSSNEETTSNKRKYNEMSSEGETMKMSRLKI